MLINPEKYIEAGNKFLNPNSFKEINTNDNFKNYKKLCSILLHIKKLGEINELDYKEIYPHTYRTPTLYFLPKTHKQDFENNLKYRPITSSYNAYWYNLSKFLAKELSSTLQYEACSNENFLKGFRKSKLSTDSIMFSLDIDNMYPSIPLGPVIEKAVEILFKRATNKISKTNLEKLLEICTSGVTFQFNNKYYKQLNGVAMGSPLAPILANIYIKLIEEKTVCSKNFPYKFEYYYRYVDDIFVIANKSVNTNNVLEYFNSIDSNIKFTLENENDNKLNFLDITVIRQESGFETRWYRKKSNTCRFTP